MVAARLVSVVVGILAIFWYLRALPAQSRTAASPDPVVARVGPATLRLSDLRARIRRMPDFQLRALGDTPDQVRRAVLERALIPDALVAIEAERQNLSRRHEVAARLREVLRDALVQELKREVSREQPVTEKDVLRYIETHRSDFESPPSLRLWWIVVSDRAAALQVAETARGVEGVKRWSDFAREKSLDRSTRFRRGDLGFVEPSGQTAYPHLRVPPEVFEAANRLPDGEISEPVRTSDGFAVIWRRGSSPAVAADLEGARGAIERAVLEGRVAARVDELVQRLRHQHVEGFRPELVRRLSPDAGVGGG